MQVLHVFFGHRMNNLRIFKVPIIGVTQTDPRLSHV